MRREICPGLPPHCRWSRSRPYSEKDARPSCEVPLLSYILRICQGVCQKKVVPPAGLEPTTFSFAKGTLYPLSYGGTIAILTFASERGKRRLIFLAMRAILEACLDAQANPVT